MSAYSGRRSSRRSRCRTLRALESESQASTPRSRSIHRGSSPSSAPSSLVKRRKKKHPPSGRKQGGSSRRSESSSTPAPPSGRGYNPQLVNYKDSEYHYGSDFEDEEEDEDAGDLDAGLEDEDQSGSRGDSEDSEFLSSLSSNEECDVEIHPDDAYFLPSSSSSSSSPPEALPLWLRDKEEQEDQRQIWIPESSLDIPLTGSNLLSALAIYEAITHYRHLIRLSPFRIEDFAQALSSEEQSNLLSEIHIALLKALLRSDEKEGSTYGPLDLKDSFHCTFYFVDSITWPENLRAFLSANESMASYKEALDLLRDNEYPFGDEYVSKRVHLLSLLVDQFLSTSAVREYISSEGTPAIEDHCRVCHRLGDMVVCDVCGGTYHLTCLDPPLLDLPKEEEDWTCTICMDNTLKGVMDGFTKNEETSRLRNEALGWDREGNKYWFICRRIFIEHNSERIKNEKDEESEASENKIVTYFSFRCQFEELMNALDPVEYEAELCEALEVLRPEIERQMEITEELTEEYRDSVNGSTYLQLEKEAMAKAKEIRETRREKAAEELLAPKESESRKAMESSKTEVKDENESSSSSVKEEETEAKDTNEDDKSESKDPSEQGEENKDVKNEEGKNMGEETSTPSAEADRDFKFGEEMASELRSARKAHSESVELYYRLGQEGNYRNYVNQYTTNPLALSKVQANEERDKKRFMSHKFSLTDASAFKWQGNLFGSRKLLINTVRQSLMQLENSIPGMFMHANWSILRKPWIGAVNQSVSSRDFSRALTVLQCCMRPCILLNVWSDQLGHVSLKRINVGSREEKKKLEKREKRESDERDERLKPFNNFVKYTLGVKHLIVKQKGEEYRSHGQHGWLWMSSVRNFKPTDSKHLGLKCGPHRLAVKYTDTRDDTCKVVLMEPRGFEYLLKRQTEIDLKKKKKKAGDIEDDEKDAEKSSDNSKIAIDTKKLEEALKNARLDRQVPSEESLKDVVDVEMGLSNPTRVLFPKVAKKAQFIDDFLARRLQLKTIEEQGLMEKSNGDDSSEKTESSSPSKPKKEEKSAKEMDPIKNELNAVINKLKEEESPSDVLTCYSPACRAVKSLGFSHSPCYSSTCPSRQNSSLKEARALYISIITKVLPSKTPFISQSFNSTKRALEALSHLLEDIIPSSQLVNGGGPERSSSSNSSDLKDDKNRIYSSKNTANKIYLKLLKNSVSSSDKKSSKIVKYPLAPHFYSKSRKAKNILILSRHDAKHLARRAGTTYAEGFNYSAKANNTFWPYPCPRPSFRTAWLYRTATLSSIHAIALQMRILWGCIRWDDMFAKPLTAEGKHQVTTETSVVTTEILKQRCTGRYLEKNEFLVKKVIIPLDTPKTVVEVTPIRSGLRKRKRAESPQQSEPKIEEDWADESTLELWEIRAFREKIEKERVAAVTRSRTGTAIREPVKYDPGLSGEYPKRERIVKGNENESPDISVKGNRVTIAGGKKLLGNSPGIVNMANTTPTTTTTSVGGTPTIIRRVTNPDGTISLVKTTPSVTPKSSALDSPIALANSSRNSPALGQQTKKVFISKDGKIIGTQVVPVGGKSSPTPSSSKPAPNPPTSINPSTTSSSSTQQKVQIVRSSDGKIQVKGLLPGQQLVQMPDGKLQIFSQPTTTSTTSSSPSTAISSSPAPPPPSKPIPEAAAPPSPKPEGKQQIVAQQLPPGSQIPPGMTVFMSNGKTYCIPKAATLAAQQQKQLLSSPQVPKKPPLPAAASPGGGTTTGKFSFMSLGANTVTYRGNQMVVSGPDQAEAQLIAKHLSSGNARLGNINGKQVLIMTPPQQTEQQQPVVSPSLLPQNPVSPSSVMQQQPTSILENSLGSPLKQEPPITNAQVTAQLIQTPQGPRIILQGIQGAVLTREQLLSIQQQVKTQLLKAQAEAKLENRVPPTKIAVVLPPSIQERINQQNKAKENANTVTTTIASNNNTTSSLSPVKRPEPVSPPKSKPEVVNASPVKLPVSAAVVAAADKEVVQPTPPIEATKNDPVTEPVPVQSSSYEDGFTVEKELSSSEAPEQGLAWETSAQSNVEIHSESLEEESKPAPPPIPLKSETLIQPPQMLPQEKRSSLIEDQRRSHIQNKISSLLFRQKEQLKKDIAKKRALQEQELSHSISMEIEKLKSSSSSSSLLLSSTAGGAGGRSSYKRKKEEDEESSPPHSGDRRKKKRSSGGAASPSDAAAIQAGIIKKDKVYCICKTKYDATKFYVGCDTCNNWFHGHCVGITEEMSKTMTEYFCDECKSAKDNQEIYCLCRQPYDDLQFYIGCERCADWFHGRCVGILQVEADNIDEYICPRCDSNTSYNYANLKPLSEHDKELVKKLVKQLLTHRNSWPFKEPVDPNDVPNYYTVVKEPMDLQTIELRVNQSQYSRLSDFVGDVMRIFENCRYFNQDNSQVIKCAESLENYFAQKLASVREKVAPS